MHEYKNNNKQSYYGHLSVVFILLTRLIACAQDNTTPGLSMSLGRRLEDVGRHNEDLYSSLLVGIGMSDDPI